MFGIRLSWNVFPRAVLPKGRMLGAVCGGVIVLGFGAAAWGWDQPGSTDHFEKHIRPLLLEKCVSCHGPEAQESNLRLDSAEGLAAGGDYGEPLVPTEAPLSGLLWRGIDSADDSLQMPPAGGLTPDEVAHLKTWIEAGAPWPAQMTLKPLTMPERIADQKARLWSLQPVDVPQPGPPLAPEAVRTGVDRHVQQTMRTAETTLAMPLAVASEADRATLIRRAALDLTGLPPTAEEVEDFVADPSPVAYERLIDRLLASPAYGERWGRHWLDVARYADTKGYAFQQDNRYPHAWTYRDYVVKALNDDVPYDRFVVEQLAADRLGLEENDYRLAALGFITVGRRFNRNEEDMDDRIDVITRGLLGMTVACARCHDHKYDGIPAADYYSLYGVLASSIEPEDLPIIDIGLELPGREKYEAELAKLSAERDALQDSYIPAIETDLREQAYDYFIHAMLPKLKKDDPRFRLTKEADELRRGLVQDLSNRFRPRIKRDDPLLGVWATLRDAKEAAFANGLTRWLQAHGGRDVAPTPVSTDGDGPVDAGAGDGPTTAAEVIARRLQSDRPESAEALLSSLGRIVAEAVEQYAAADRKLDSLDVEARLVIEALNRNGDFLTVPKDRLRNAFHRNEREKVQAADKKIKALESTEPGAPPRAMVMFETRKHDPRIFLRGNPGSQGDAVPRQFLALLTEAETRKPYETGGRLDLAEDIVDPSNPLTARVMADRVWMHHFGEPLVSTPGDFGSRSDPPVQGALLDYLADFLVTRGWSVKALHREILLSHTYRQSSNAPAEVIAADPDNAYLARQNRRRLEWEALRDRALQAGGLLRWELYGRTEPIHTEKFSRRRTLYGTIDRQDLPNLFRVFNFPNPDACSPRRPDTTVPQQGLFWLNSAVIRSASEGLADDVLQVETLPERTARLYRHALGRNPSEDEKAQVAEFVTAVAGAEPEPAVIRQTWQALAQALLMTNEFAFVD